MSDALAAALLASQRGRQQFDPAENSRKFARMLMQQGSSTAPVQSWGEGLARALTGVAGGFFEGQGRREGEDKNRRLIEGLTGAYGAPDEASAMEALKGLGDDGSGVLAPFLASMISQKFADRRKNQILDTKLDAGGVGMPGAQPGMGGGQQGPLTIDMTPLPSATPAPGAFNNNVGNLRVSNAPWEGKGAPQNGFETFATPQQGVNAAFKNLGAYVQQNPNMTVAEAIAKWAPPNENNTQQYISQVAEGTGINPGMPLAEVLKDPAVAAQLLDAITRKEKGGLPQGVTADTFMTATGGAPGQPQPQVAQPTGAPGGPQTTPQPAPVTTLPEVSPAAQALAQQALQARNGGDRERALVLMQKAQEAQAAYVQERAKTQDTRAYEQQTKERERGIKQRGALVGERERFDGLNSKLDRMATEATRILNHPGLGMATGTMSAVPGIGGTMTIPGTDAADFKASLEALKSQVGFAVLQEMRDASKTGGALGQVSDRENTMLQANLASLDTAQSVDSFKAALQRIIEYTQESKGRFATAFNAKAADAGVAPAAAAPSVGAPSQQNQPPPPAGGFDPAYEYRPKPDGSGWQRRPKQ